MIKKLFNCSVIDVEKGEILNNRVIIIKGDRIDFIGKENEISKYNVDEEINIKNNYVLPGLIDLHTHISFDGSPNSWYANLQKEKPGYRAIRAVNEVKKYLENGITIIRDVGSVDYTDIAVRDAIKDGFAIGPTIFCSGPPLSITGGHGDVWVREDVKPVTLGYIVDGVDAVRRATRMIIRQGVDWIKIFVTGGIASEGDRPDFTQFSLDELNACVQEARAAKRKVAVHAHGIKGIENAIKVGVDSIEHGSMLIENPELALAMAQKGIALVPTLTVTNFIVKKGPEEGLPEFAIRKAEYLLTLHKESVKVAHKAGVLIATGTDAGYIVRHGETAYELMYLTQVGLSNLEAMQAGTINAAKTLGIENYFGSVKPGKFADLLVLDLNPLDNIAAFMDKNRVKAVFKSGKLVISRGIQFS